MAASIIVSILQRTFYGRLSQFGTGQVRRKPSHGSIMTCSTSLLLSWQENFELSRVVVEHERDWASEQEQYKRDLTNERERYGKLLLHERKKRYGLLAFVFVTLSAAIIYISYLLSPQSVIPNGGLVMTALAILLTLIEVLFLRES